MATKNDFKLQIKSATDSTDQLIPERAKWDRPLEFLLSCLSYAVGLGNVWRFPYLCYRNGGGAFLIPYGIMLFVIGLPIFFLELVVGQYSGMGPIESYQNIAPIFQGIGLCVLVVITFVTIYYMVIVSWTMFYVFASFSSELPWGSCQNSFNTANCYSGIEEAVCKEKNLGNEFDTIFWKKTCFPVKELCAEFELDFSSVTHCKNASMDIPITSLISRVYASQEYYSDYVLGINGATWETFGYPDWKLLICLTLSWIITYICVSKGIQTAGKVVYFTALFPYVILIALLVRGLTLEGAMEGIKFYIQPDWSKLLVAQVWGDAASQIFYSFGISCGSLITLASYNKFSNNCHTDAVFVSITNGLTGFFAGFCIFSVLGFLANNLNVPVQDVATEGPGLTFAVYPEAILRMPLPQVWSILFFFMLFILGLGSQFAGIQAMCTSILDYRPQWRENQSKVIAGVCFFCYLVGIPMTCPGGIYLFTLFDWNTASWAIFLIGIAEVGAVSWAYGCNRMLDNIGDMGMKLSRWTRGYWYVVWTFITPALLFGVFLFVMSKYEAPFYEDYAFPWWATGLGWCISVSTLLPLFIFGIYQVCIRKTTFAELFKPTSKWGPSGTLDTNSQGLPKYT